MYSAIIGGMIFGFIGACCTDSFFVWILLIVPVDLAWGFICFEEKWP